MRRQYSLALLTGINWGLALEVSLVLIWAVIVAQNYLDLNPLMIPGGGEFSSVILNHHMWTRFTDCGICALWNGSIRGGFPALVDTLGSALHPLVIFTTLFFGVINGAKVSLIIAFGAAGLAQLWLGAELGLKAPARLWTALMVIAAGHLSGKMELGLFSMVLSITMASFTFPAALYLARKRSLKAAVIFGVILALLTVSGQGYIQSGLLLISPAYLILFWGRDRAFFSRYLLAAGVGFLLAAPFLVPFLHFYPNFLKDSDLAFSAGQPLEYFVLNLVIDDVDFFSSTILTKLPYANLYNIFVGWVPVLLAILSLRFAQREDARRLFFLLASSILALLVGSTVLLRWLVPLIPSLAALRFAPFIGGLAIPPLLALAGYGLDGLMKVPWPKISIYSGLSEESPEGWELDLRWILLFPLLFALSQGYDFAQNWLYLYQRNPDIYEVLDGLETESLAWVQPPYGEHDYIEPAIAQGLKLSPAIMPWVWADRPFPEPLIEANRNQPPEFSIDVKSTIGDVVIYQLDTVPYAGVHNISGVEPCRAMGIGGDLTITCETTQPGLLVVQENQWSGWYAWQDGERIPLFKWEKRLTVEAPAGSHTYRFRYLPWDVLLGVCLFLGGIGLSIVLWRREG